jgi:hypothetical protein
LLVALLPLPRLRAAAARGALRPAVDVGGAVAERANATICCTVGSAGASSCGRRRRCGPLGGVGFGGLRVRGAVPERQAGGALHGDDRRRRERRVARMGAAVRGGGFELLQRQCSVVGVYVHVDVGVGSVRSRRDGVVSQN